MDELEPGGRPDAPEPGPVDARRHRAVPVVRARAAEKAGHSLDHELALLTVHGVLHLLGYDLPSRRRRRRCSPAEPVAGRWYEDLRRAEREAQLAARDQQLLGKPVFFDGTEQ
ncbi:hypothetical protein GS461_15725 [Rhodococcus hoagii]|nr:hypothetical protein [Prescottella equi]